MSIVARTLTSMSILLFLAFFTAFPAEAKPPDNLQPVEIKPGDAPTLPRKGARADTLYIYGGPGTLEGKFQTGDMQPDPQGWWSEDLTAGDPDGDHWHIDNFNCANLDLSVPDNHAYWCGSDYTPCSGYPSDQVGGYGNDMNAALVWEGEVPDSLVPVLVRLTYAINWDLEAGWDFVRLQVYRQSSDSWDDVSEYTGAWPWG